MTEPLPMMPLAKPRVWGGRALAEYGKRLPDGPVGESWEFVDRADDQSVVADGPLAGTTLNQLWQERRELFGSAARENPAERFPLLIKLLDAEATLSVQVHPPAALARELGEEPKTECWYVLDAAPDAHLYAGLRVGVDRAAFTGALANGGPERLLQTLPVARGDALLVPSGRVHAIGAGCLIYEVQQNSDTTFRVWDFNRPGLDGKPRELHVEQSLRSIDFDDHRPALQEPAGDVVARCEHFVLRHRAATGITASTPERCGVVTVIAGEAVCAGRVFSRGSTFLVPAGCDEPLTGGGEILHVELP